MSIDQKVEIAFFSVIIIMVIFFCLIIACGMYSMIGGF